MSAWSASSWRNRVMRAGVRRIAAASALAVCVVVLCAFASTQTAAKPDTKQAVTCGTCHAGVVSSYANAPMRHAMEPAETNPTLMAHPDLAVQQNGYSYSVQTKGGVSTYAVSDATGTLSLPIHWVFGQHSQTFVLEKDGKLYESLVSYFPREQGLGTTPGDESLKPKNLTEAMGRELSQWESLSCFNCHASGATKGTQLTLKTLTPGLECERCHAGAQQHMLDAQNDNFKTVPKSLKRMSTGEISNFCGQCHRSWETVVRNHWKGPAFVRFQPYRLQNSKCFAADDPRISCLACHNPHQQVNHDQAFYDKKCLACHAETHVASAAAAPGAKTCPVAKDKCSTCHMPKVELPGGHALFTDHQIRVVHAGDAYPN
ncbi:cytochrome c family protein [Occallatibacter riparius]|uniref:Cytochrome c family protein n=1 Tax=Occallatibacter riparius TaxID=1002689 RepID=A0A9J7BSL4_9BACT|nr:cytochrome c family protein [Occallatibacter riparius]UWZ85591.1 cytochrome c family protein [Occallatibacter riparius]